MKDEELLSIIKELKEEIKAIKSYKIEYDPNKPIIYSSNNIHYMNLSLYSIISQNHGELSFISYNDVKVKDEILPASLYKDSLEKEFENISSFLNSLNGNHPFFIFKDEKVFMNLNCINFICTLDSQFTFSIFNGIKNTTSISHFDFENFNEVIKYNEKMIYENKNIFKVSESLLINLNNLSKIEIIYDKNKYSLKFSFLGEKDNNRKIIIYFDSKKEAEAALNKILSYSQSLFNNKSFKFKQSNNVISL